MDLTKESKELIKEEVDKVFENNLKEIQEALKNTINNVFTKELEKTLDRIENKKYTDILNKTESILETYVLEKNRINNLKDVYTTIKKIEESNGNANAYEQELAEVEKEEKKLNFITTIFNEYISEYEENDKQKGTYTRKVNLLKNYYMKRKRKEDIIIFYENDRRIDYDKKELIKDLAPRLFGIFGYLI